MLTFGRMIPITIYPSFWFLVVGLGWSSGSGISGIMLFALVALISLLTHELGHAYTAYYFGQRATIELTLFGGMTNRVGPPIGLLRDFLVIAMGPILSIILAMVSYIVIKSAIVSGSMMSFFSLMLLANAFWTVVNLLPIHPLDGGKIMAIIMMVLFPQSGRRWSFLVSACFGLLACVFFFSQGAIFGGAVFALCFWESLQGYRLLRDTGEGEGYSQELDELDKMVWSGRQEEAVIRLQTLLKKSIPKTITAQACEQLAQLQLTRDCPREAYETILASEQKMQGDLPYELLTLKQLAAYRISKFQESAATGKEAFRIRPELATALLLSLANGQLHQVHETLNWLNSCKELGFTDFSKLLECSDFDSLRHDPLIREFGSNV